MVATNHAAMLAFARYLYNTSGNQFAADIFPNRHLAFQAEYAEAWAATPAAALGKLDDENQRKLFDLIWERHGDST